jgi:hypothetical protein
MVMIVDNRVGKASEDQYTNAPRGAKQQELAAYSCKRKQGNGQRKERERMGRIRIYLIG